MRHLYCAVAAVTFHFESAVVQAEILLCVSNRFDLLLMKQIEQWQWKLKELKNQKAQLDRQEKLIKKLYETLNIKED